MVSTASTSRPAQSEISAGQTVPDQQDLLDTIPNALFRLKSNMRDGFYSSEGYSFAVCAHENADGTFTYDFVTTADIVGADLIDQVNLYMNDYESFTLTSLDNSLSFSAALIGLDPVANVAILRVETPRKIPTFNVVAEAPQEKNAVFVPNITGDQVKLKDTVIVNDDFRLSDQAFSGCSVDSIPIDQKQGLPVFDKTGNIVGIYLTQRDPGAPSKSDSFIIRSDRMTNAYKGILDEKGVTYGDWGLVLSSTGAVSRQFFLPPERLGSGLWVSNLFAESAAERAGLQRGDIILSVDGDVAMANATTPEGLVPFYTFMRESAVGQSVSLLVYRPSIGKEVDLTLSAQTMTFGDVEVFDTLIGFKVCELPEIFRSLNNVPHDLEGVVISESSLPNLSARRVIVRLNGIATPDVPAFQHAFEQIQARNNFTIDYVTIPVSYQGCYQCEGLGAHEQIVLTK